MGGQGAGEAEEAREAGVQGARSKGERNFPFSPCKEPQFFLFPSPQSPFPSPYSLYLPIPNC